MNYERATFTLALAALPFACLLTVVPPLHPS